MNEIEVDLKVTFAIIPFKASEGNQGRCIKCDGREMCGLSGNALKCPCGMNEQLKIVRGVTTKP